MATVDDTKTSELASLAGELVNAAEGRAREDVARRIGVLLADSAKAKAAAPQAPADYPLTFSAAPGVFALARGAKAGDIHDHLSARLSQLSALLAMTYGEGFQAFSAYSDTIQENYLWTCSTLADECSELFDALGSVRRGELGAPEFQGAGQPVAQHTP